MPTNNVKRAIDKILPIKCSNAKEFFNKWIEYLTPIHHLTARERDVLVLILYKRYILSKGVFDSDIIDSMVLNDNGRTEIRTELNMSTVQLNGILARLTKLKILKPVYKQNGRINTYLTSPSFIPDYNDEDFKVLLVFKNG